MTLEEYNAYCKSLRATTHVVQWGGSDVWKVGGKVFAIAGVRDDVFQVTFKTSKIAYEVLKDTPGLRPAPYLASRGMSWIQHYTDAGLNDQELREHIEASHALVASGLTKKLQRQLGFIEWAQRRAERNP